MLTKKHGKEKIKICREKLSGTLCIRLDRSMTYFTVRVYGEAMQRNKILVSFEGIKINK